MSKVYYIVEKLPVQGRISFMYEIHEHEEYQAELVRAAASNVLETYGCRITHGA